MNRKFSRLAPVGRFCRPKCVSPRVVGALPEMLLEVGGATTLRGASSVL